MCPLDLRPHFTDGEIEAPGHVLLWEVDGDRGQMSSNRMFSPHFWAR